MPDFSEWVPFMGRHAVYAVAWPAAAVAEINSWREPSGRLRSLPKRRPAGNGGVWPKGAEGVRSYPIRAARRGCWRQLCGPTGR